MGANNEQHIDLSKIISHLCINLNVMPSRQSLHRMGVQLQQVTVAAKEGKTNLNIDSEKNMYHRSQRSSRKMSNAPK